MFKEYFREFLRENNFDSRYADVMEFGYWPNSHAVTLFQKWYKEKYPRVLALLSPDVNTNWVDKVLEKISNTYEDISQVTMMGYFVAFLKKYPEPDNEKLIKRFLGPGHCTGFVFTYAAAYFLNKMDWLNNTFELLIKWGKSFFPLQTEQRKDILKLIRIVNNSQYSTFNLQLSNARWAEQVAATYEAKVDVNSRMYLLPQKTGIKIATETIFPRLPALSMPAETKSEEENPVHIFLLGLNDHATLLIKETYRDTGEVSFIFYDPNNVSKPIYLEQMEDLYHLLPIAHGPARTPFQVQLISSANLSYYPTPESFIKYEPITLGDKLAYLFLATMNGCESLLDCLSSKNPEIINVRTPRGEGLLHVATSACEPDILRFLLRLKNPSLDVNHATTRSGRTPLHKACQRGDFRAARILLEHKASVDSRLSTLAPKNPGFTALHLAAKKGNPELIDTLIRSNPALDIKTPTGDTAMHIAAECGHIAIVKSLLKAGADKNLLGSKGKSVWGIAKEKNNAGLKAVLCAQAPAPVVVARLTVNSASAMFGVAGSSSQREMIAKKKESRQQALQGSTWIASLRS